MTSNKLFWRFALVLTLIFAGMLTHLSFLPMAGISLTAFWLVHPLIHKWASPHRYLPYTGFWAVICLSLSLSVFTSSFAVLTCFTSLLWSGYAVTSHLPNQTQPRLTGRQTKQLTTIPDLKLRVKTLNQDLEQLAAEQHQLDLLSYQAKAQHLLTGLNQLKQDLTKQKKQLDEQTYLRLLTRIETEENQLQQNLASLLEPQVPHAQADAHYHPPQDLPADLADMVEGIYADSQVIINRIKASSSSNKAELLQLHQTHMGRFDSILKGYLAIRLNPNHYFDAQNRLDTAKASMEGFAHSLKDQVRQLNEDDMHEFEINLKLLNTQSRQGDLHDL